MEKQIVGRIDKIDIPEFGLENVKAKVDTGANRSSIHCSKIEYDGKGKITFQIPLVSNHGVNTFHSTDFFKKKIKSSSGHVEERYVIKTDVILFGERIATTFSLTDRTDMRYPVLLGRKLLAKRFIVDVDQQNLSYKAKKKQYDENSNIVPKS